MFYHQGGQLQYEVEVEEPNPIFAKMLQEAIGGLEGELRVALQYMAQAMSLPDNEEYAPYKRALLDTATEEFAHIEMLATAVHKNLQGAPSNVGVDGNELAMLAGLQPRQFLSSGMNPLFVDANGHPFSGNYVVASGNLAADMFANVAAESTGRLLATRLYEATDDPGMKDMLSFLIARDTMHQNQWVQILKDLGDPEDPWDTLPVPDSFPDEAENQEFNYAFMSTNVEAQSDPEQPWTQGDSPDGEGTFSYVTQHDVDGFAPNISEAPAETYNDPGPANEDDGGGADTTTTQQGGDGTTTQQGGDGDGTTTTEDGS